MCPRWVPCSKIYLNIPDPYERRACKAMELVSKLMTKEEKARNKGVVIFNCTREWKFVSRVLDRTLFVVFTFVALCFNIYLLTASPYGRTFDFCPREGACEGMTEEEVRQLLADIAQQKTSGSGVGIFGGGGGGH